jgi:ADP-ribose pyrophosphatase YjhB (NUDIX family)
MKGAISGSIAGFPLVQLPFQRQPMTWLAHTSVATIVERDGLFLMVEETDEGRTVFNQPAGHLEKGESISEGAIRETLEETAWLVEPEALVGIYHYPAPNGVTYVRFCFAASPLKEEPGRTLDAGILSARWLTEQEIMDPAFPARSPIVRQCLQDYLGGRRFPLSVIWHYQA